MKQRSLYNKYASLLIEADEVPPTDDVPTDDAGGDPGMDTGGGDMGMDSGNEENMDAGGEAEAGNTEDATALGDPEDINYKANKSKLSVFEPYLQKIAKDNNIELDPQIENELKRLYLQVWKVAYSKGFNDAT